MPNRLPLILIAVFVIASCSVAPELKIPVASPEGKADQPVQTSQKAGRDAVSKVDNTAQNGYFNISTSEGLAGAGLLGLISWLWFTTRQGNIRKDTDFEQMRRENERHQADLSAWKEISLAQLRLIQALLEKRI